MAAAVARPSPAAPAQVRLTTLPGSSPQPLDPRAHVANRRGRVDSHRRHGGDHRRHGGDHRKPGEIVAGPAKIVAGPAKIVASPAEGIRRKPGEDRRRPGEDRRRPGEDRHGKPGEDRRRPGEDRRRPGEDRRKPRRRFSALHLIDRATFRPAMNLPDTHALSPTQYEDLLANTGLGDPVRRSLTEFAYRKINKAVVGGGGGHRADRDPAARLTQMSAVEPEGATERLLVSGDVAQGVIANRRRQLKSGRVEDALRPGRPRRARPRSHRRDRRSPRPSPPRRAHRARARRQVATDRACALVLRAFQAEIDDPREQAATTELAMQAVYNARSKLRATVTQIAQTFDQGTLP